MWNILIIDDEQPARDRLRRLVGAIPDCRVAGEAANGAEALAKIPELAPEILLLDISMPGMDGMALARVLQEGGASPAVIFCTAYQDQALKAFEVEAVDYLVKPVNPSQIILALNPPIPWKNATFIVCKGIHIDRLAFDIEDVVQPQG